MQRFYHSNRRHIIYVTVVSVLLLLLVSIICFTATIPSHQIANIYKSLNDVVPLPSATWSRPAEQELVVTSDLDLVDGGAKVRESQLLQPQDSTSADRVQLRQLRQLQNTIPLPPIVQIKGELRKWHKVTLAIQGPMTSETNATNPFTNYR